MSNIKGNKSNMLTAELKLKIIHEYFASEKSFSELAQKYKISSSSIRRWCKGFEDKGESFIFQISSRKNQNIGINRKNIPRINSLDPKDQEIAKLKKQIIYKKCLIVDFFKTELAIYKLYNLIKITQRTYFQWVKKGRLKYLYKFDFKLAKLIKEIKKNYLGHQELRFV